MHPCNNCSSRGLGSSCTYSTTTSRPNGQAHVQDRINQLENLVLSLMQQSPVSAGPSPPEDGPQTQSTLDRLPGQDRSPPDQSSGQQLPEQPRTSRPRTQRGVSPSPSDYGSLSIRDSSVAYVSSAHYGAILDSIAELKHHFAQEDEEEESMPDPVQPQTKFPVPHLLHSNCPVPGTRESILAAIPPRPVVDRLVSCWFNSLDLAPGKLSRTRRSRSLLIWPLCTDIFILISPGVPSPSLTREQAQYTVASSFARYVQSTERNLRC